MYHQPVPHRTAPSLLADMVMARGIATPDATAIIQDDQSWTYRDLARRASELTAKIARAPRPGAAAVAVCGEKSFDVVAGIIAALKANCAYAPLDTAHPDDRLASILEDLRPATVFLDPAARERLGTAVAEAGAEPIDLRTAANLVRATRIAPDRFQGSAPVAAVLHTSGSTGKPKSVLIEAEAIRVFAEWVRDEFDLSKTDRVLSHAPFAFDLSFLDLFASINTGAAIVLTSAAQAKSGAALGDIIEATGVTVWHSAPSALALLADANEGRRFGKVRLVMFAGEPMPAQLMARLRKRFPKARFVNIYGCTETNDTFFYNVPDIGCPDPMPIGQPLPYVDWKLLDEKMQPVEDGQAGELWVSCPTMMCRYGDIEQTAKSVQRIDGKRFYKSRDRVSCDARGVFHFHGRSDSIVKIGGTRVDLLEVEQCIGQAEGVADVAATVVGDGPNARIAVSVTVTSPSVTSLALRMHSMKRLPSLAIPRLYDISPMPLPKNANGKICRKSVAQNWAQERAA